MRRLRDLVRGPGRRPRWRVVVPAVAVLVAGLLIWRAVVRKGETGRLEFPLELLEADPVFAPNDHPWETFRIEGASADGKWLWLHAPRARPPSLLFDVEQRRFVAAWRGAPPLPINGWICDHLPMLVDGWASDRMVVIRAKGRAIYQESDHTPWCNCDGAMTMGEYYRNKLRPRSAKRHVCFYALDVASRQMRFLFEETITVPKQMLDARKIRPNREHTAFFYTIEPNVEKLRPDGRREEVFVIRDLATGRRRVLEESDFELHRRGRIWTWGWLPDDRTIVLCEIRDELAQPGQSPALQTRVETLHFLDIRKDKRPRKVTVAASFDRLRAQSVLRADEGATCLIDLMGIADQGRRIRLVATFYGPGALADSNRDRSSIWDLDVASGRLERVANLGQGAAYKGGPVYSPNGRSLLIPVPSAAAVDAPATGTLGLVRYEVGLPPIRLPFKLTALAHAAHPTRSVPYVRDRVVFLDDQTVVSVDAGYMLVKYNLRTGRSEMLWKSKRGERRP